MKLVDNKPKKLYICDPKKNRKCKGKDSRHCGKQCFCTTNKKFAKDPDHALTYEEYDKEDVKIGRAHV